MSKADNKELEEAINRIEIDKDYAGLTNGTCIVNKQDIKIVLKELKRQMYGRKDCTIFISYSCSNEIEKMDFSDYLELEKDLKTRNIKIQVEKV